VSNADPCKGSSVNDPLAELSADDFAGHSEFGSLTVEQKLLWLAHAASFALEARRLRPSLRAAESQAGYARKPSDPAHESDD
jgi:hypothetical protein